MTRWILALLAVGSATACQPPAVREAQAAEDRLKILESSFATKDEICSANREVAEAWLKALERDKYQMAKLRADTACLEADLERLRR